MSCSRRPLTLCAEQDMPLLSMPTAAQAQLAFSQLCQDWALAGPQGNLSFSPADTLQGGFPK